MAAIHVVANVHSMMTMMAYIWDAFVLLVMAAVLLGNKMSGYCIKMSSNSDEKVNLDISGNVVPNAVKVEEPPKPDPGFFESIGNAFKSAFSSGNAKAMIRPINMNGQPMRK